MKIGTYSIPQYRLASLLIDIKKIYEQFKSEEASVEDIAHSLNQAYRGGGFLQKMADLRTYGLIEGRGSKIKVTDLAKKATYGDPVERTNALEKLVTNIPLWGILFDKYGISIKEEGFWIDLKRITGAEPMDAQKQANYVRNAYIDDTKYISTVKVPTPRPEPESPESGGKLERARDRRVDVEATTKDAVVYIKYPGIGIVNLDINETNLSLAEQIIKSIKATLQKEKPPSDEPSSPE